MSRCLPSIAEGAHIVKIIYPRFQYFVRQFDTKKFPTACYEKALEKFKAPADLSPDVLRNALLWKYGYLGKTAIPDHQHQLIEKIQKEWPALFKADTKFPTNPALAFKVLDQRFGPKKTRFITLAFLLHLLFPRHVPIIDQHNFRAVNGLMSDIRVDWPPPKKTQKPSQYSDIECIADFTKSVLDVWARNALAPVPSAQEFDRFLMMYGKDLKKKLQLSHLRGSPFPFQ